MVFGISLSAAQLGIPKIKIPKAGGGAPVSKVAQGPLPEVKAIKPDAVPPGWQGDVVFTGTNFIKSMSLRLDCVSFRNEDFHVESAERAVLHVKIPPRTEETKCLVVLAVFADSAEIGPSGQGTPQIVQVSGPSFAISGSSNLPVARGACLMGEGPIGKADDMASKYEGYLNLQMEFQKQFQTNPNFIMECEFYVSPDTVKYVQGGKTVFEKPSSTVAKVEKFVMPTPFGEQPTDVFSIAWTDGKIQNFMGVAKDNSPPSQAYDDLKSKLKK